MKVGMYYRNSDVRVEEKPVPEVRKGDILLRVKACGICGSDLLEWYRIKKAPLVLGHELSGEVVETGADVGGFKVKDRVFSTHHVPCDACHYCLTGHPTACETFHSQNNFAPGGFSEYLRVSGRSLASGTFLLDDSTTDEEASFVEPLGTAVRGLRTAGLKPGDSLLVLGSGIVGLLIIKLACVLGAGKIFATDLSPFRLDAARRFGASEALDAGIDLPEKIRQANQGRLADKVMICAGALSACRQALSCVDRGGTVVFFAVPKPGEELSIDFNPFWRNDVSFVTSYGASPLDNHQALELIRTRRVCVNDMITHRFGLQEISKAFSVASKAQDSLKVLVIPNP